MSTAITKIRPPLVFAAMLLLALGFVVSGGGAASAVPADSDAADESWFDEGGVWTVEGEFIPFAFERARPCGQSVDPGTVNQYGYVLYFRNCNSIALSLRPSYLPGILPGTCKTASPYSTVSWYIYSPNAFLGLKSC